MSYGKTVALRDVTFQLNAGEFLALVGPNGGGKSTIIKLILAIILPTSGKVRVFGRQAEQARERIGYLPQSAQLDPLFPATVCDVASMGRLRPTWLPQRMSRRDRETVASALEQVDLVDLRNRPVGELSGGQRQRTLLARALATEPDLLVLDEPAAGLDPASADELYDLLSSLSGQVSIVMASHDIEAVHHYASVIGVVDTTFARYSPHEHRLISGEHGAHVLPAWATTRTGAHHEGPWKADR